jgi:formylglycine-generating enzyme
LEPSSIALGVVVVSCLTATDAGVPQPATAFEGMVLVPGGRFFMGVQPGTAPEGTRLGHEEVVLPFWIDKTEVTVGQYVACVDAKHCKPTRAKGMACNVSARRLTHPINCIRWSEADAYCRSVGKRLPTEAEWERAARGTDERIYPWGRAAPDEQLCWDHADQTRTTTCQVGSFPSGASPYGVLDMAGNVAEWTSSSPASKLRRDQRIFKGGGFVMEPLAMGNPDWLDYRTEQSGSNLPTFDAIDLGFRCARDGVEGATEPAEAATSVAPTVSRPAAGSPERKALLDAVRAKLGVTCEFKVDRLVVAGDWAYFEGIEHRTDGNRVAALLRRTVARWNAEELAVAAPAHWTDVASQFRDRLRATKSNLPTELMGP